MIHYMTTNGLGNAWVGNELRIVARAGIPIALHTIRRPESTFFDSEWAQELDRRSRALYPLPVLGSAISLLAAPLLFRGGFFSALANAVFGERESLRVRVAGLWHLIVAAHWARGVRHEPISLIHSQWVHSSGSVAMYGAWLLGVPFSFTGHAADLFRDRCALRTKVGRAAFIVCISTFHADFFRKLGARDEQLRLAYCGIDVSHFAPGSRADRRVPPRVLAAGRLVEKKGFTFLLDACRLLVDRGVALDCVIAGSGPLDAELRAKIRQLGLDDCVRMTGEALKQELIPEFMHDGDIFCLPSVWSSDNDVEGLPQLLMEAMACGLPAISTRIVGVPDLVKHEETGLLVEPEDVQGLAEALERLLSDEALASRLAVAGREHVLEKFDIDTSLESLIGEFRRRLADSSPEGQTAETNQ